MSLEQLLRDYNLSYNPNGQWVNVCCPHCQDSGLHLGIPQAMNVAHCWKCGSHSITETLSKLLGIPTVEARKILRFYGGTARTKPIPEPKIAIHPFTLPPSHPLNSRGRAYLANRRFDPQKLEQEWGIMQTGRVSFLDGIFYSYRLIIPIRWKGEAVSFTSRDITGKGNPKYLTCPISREKIHHKHILYGNWERIKQTRSVIIVEGPTDVWRLGPNAAATFGTAFTTEQVLAINELADRIWIVFDSEPQAQEQTRKLAIKLRALGKGVEIITLPKGDPAEMRQEDANDLVQKLREEEQKTFV